jgi:enoyl-CoA hydratase/carnithine racemase
MPAYAGNGIDMAWIDYQAPRRRRAAADSLQQLSPETASHPIWARAERLLARLLTFPLPTAAAINGHWVAWGCMLGLAFDYRVMREDRGYNMYVPAVDIGAVCL